MFRAFEDVLGYLNRATDYERQSAPYSPGTYNLERMRRLVAALDHPERAFRSLHVAGTKGKGSVAHMAEAILRAAGHRTGLYTSPHLVDLRERIRIGGRILPPGDLVWAMNRMERPLRRLKPTYFEIMTAAAFVLFARRRVDWAVVEVGLGGRLDATNVIVPAACAITPVDYDHMDKLGSTLGAIAAEKAGIVKPGVPVVVGPQRPAPLRAIRRACRPLSPKVFPGRRRGFVLNFIVEGIRGDRYRCALRVLGRHQAWNAGTAIALVEAAGLRPGPAEIRKAFSGLRLPGRIEVVGRRPWMIVDSAHNPVSARALAEALRDVPRKRTVLVFGASADKDWRGMLRILQPGTEATVFTRAAGPRAADPALLAESASGPSLLTRGVAEALDLARVLAGPGDAIVVAGSVYVAGEALNFLGGGP